MGIELMNGVPNYQVTSTAKTAGKADAGVKADTSMDVTSSPVTDVQATATASATSKQNDVDETGSSNSKGNEKETTMKDVKEINKLLNTNTIAEFGYNEPTKRIIIKIKDRDTDEVIKEIPSEKALEMLARVWELAGILVDEKR